MSILTGDQIKREVKEGAIKILPYREEFVQPNSIDLTLGEEVKVYSGFVEDSALGQDNSFAKSRALSCVHGQGYLDSKSENAARSFTMDESGWLIVPGILYLMHTEEVIGTNKYVTQLNGKSSVARLGVIIHFTAAYGDTGFMGQYTLEVSGVHPVRVYPGMKIAQAVFYETIGQTVEYDGNYTGECAMGAQTSRSWRQF